jgi:hypothetical protein
MLAVLRRLTTSPLAVTTVPLTIAFAVIPLTGILMLSVTITIGTARMTGASVSV